MKKIFIFLTFLCLLNGCVESVALLGSTAGGASSGRILQSSLNSAISYGIKKQTGKTPIGHALAYAEEKNPEKQKKSLTKDKILNNKKHDKSVKDLSSSLQSKIDKKSEIKYLD